MDSWKFYLETYGCKVNQHETQLLREAWQNLGGVECHVPEDAHYICINSCAITGKAERDARNAVFRLKKQCPEAKLILTGCAAQFFADFVPRKNANYARPDSCVPQKDKHKLLSGPWGTAARRSAHVPPLTGYNRARPIVKAQDGCSQNCAYCIVPSTRGKPRSYDPASILDECRRLFEAGYGELTLSGINLRQYGRDRPEYGDFWDLLQYVDQNLRSYKGLGRLRISSLEPAQLTERGLDILAETEIVCPHVHLSLQHASPWVLRRMGRGHYNMEMVLDFLAGIKNFWPVCGVGADLLVGFPGESENDIEILLDFISASPLTYAHVFPYSRRQNTPAQNFPDQISMKIKNERAARARQAAGNKKTAFWRQLLHLEKMVVAPDLPSEHNTGLPRRGVNEFYVPCHIVDDNPGTGLATVRPVEAMDNGLLVKIRP